MTASATTSVSCRVFFRTQVLLRLLLAISSGLHAVPSFGVSPLNYV
jgi:hypothetical protein